MTNVCSDMLKSIAVSLVLYNRPCCFTSTVLLQPCREMNGLYFLIFSLTRLISVSDWKSNKGAVLTGNRGLL